MASRDRLLVVPAARRSSKRSAPDAQCPSGRRVFSSAEWVEIGNSLRLSARELQLVQGVFDDEPEASIARELKLSVNTVHSYFERLYRKLGVASRCGVVLRVMAEYMSASRSATGHVAGVLHPVAPEPA